MGFVFDPSSCVYRIQNVSYQRYLSLSGTSVTVAGYSDGDANQQWRFVYPPGSASIYYIQSVGNPNLYLNAGAWTTYYIVSGTSGSCQWTVTPNSSGVTTIIYASSYYLGFDGMNVGAGYLHSSNNQQWTLNNQQWTLTAVVALPSDPPALLTNKFPLQTGYYRIRSFNSDYLLTMSNDKEEQKAYISQQDRKILTQQKWYVTHDEKTGLYTIQNSGTGLYLACGSADASQDSPLVGQSGSPYSWCVQSVVPGIMFFIGLSAPMLSIGFSDYEAENLSEVALEPSDNIPSQIWFFENAQPLGQDKVHARRELDPGEYTIECCHDNRYLYDSQGLTSDTADRASKFTLAYLNDTSPVFTLRVTTGKKLYVTNTSGYIELRSSSNDDNKQWVLLPQKSESKLVYYICQISQGHPLKVISSRLIDDQYFALDEISVGQAMQMWNFDTV